MKSIAARFSARSSGDERLPGALVDEGVTGDRDQEDVALRLGVAEVADVPGVNDVEAAVAVHDLRPSLAARSGAGGVGPGQDLQRPPGERVGGGWGCATSPSVAGRGGVGRSRRSSHGRR